MRIPSRVKIGAQRYRVVECDSISWRDDELLGLTRCGVGEISIARTHYGRDVPEDSKSDTFLHEVIHSVSGVYGLGLSERQVSGLAGGLLQVIRDNRLDFRRGEVGCKGKGGKVVRGGKKVKGVKGK